MFFQLAAAALGSVSGLRGAPRSLLVLGLLGLFVDFRFLVRVDEGGQALLGTLLARIFEECLRGRGRVRHVLTRVESGRVLLFAADQLIFRLHAVGRLADLTRVVVETVVHVLHIHHVHVAASPFDQRQLLDVASLVTVGVGGVAHVISAFRRHATFLVVAHLEVWKFLLGLDGLLLRRVNVRYLALLVSKIAHGAKLI